MMKPLFYCQDNLFQPQKQRKLRFDIILEAATAIMQKTEESSMTYLNRGQLYVIGLNDPSGLDEVVTSTLSIDFHNASHRSISENYWKYWLTQQKQPDARALDIDLGQSIGILNVSLPSFDKISFSWNTRIGAKIYIRFKCLSTDFSRIKGVKGIPLRAQMENRWGTESESCYCKSNSKSLSLLYKESSPFTLFSQIPSEPKHHTRIMTAPQQQNMINYQDHLFISTNQFMTPPPLTEEETESLCTPLQVTPTDLYSIYFTPPPLPSDYFSQPKLACFDQE
ncbi:hypothetical protein G6F52_011850 [Rhizopus delemar]|nr:hypothetical protein G6F52_011850 [Rhizopus delemar]